MTNNEFEKLLGDDQGINNAISRYTVDSQINQVAITCELRNHLSEAFYKRCEDWGWTREYADKVMEQVRKQDRENDQMWDNYREGIEQEYYPKLIAGEITKQEYNDLLQGWEPGY